MADENLTVLAIDDDLGDAELLRRNLEELYGQSLEFVHFTDPGIAQKELSGRHVDVTFLDYHLGCSSGLEVLRAIREEGDMRPLVVLTGCGDEYAAAKLAREGADDYIAKRDLSPDILREAILSAKAGYSKRKTDADRAKQRETLTRLVMEANVQLVQRSRLDSLTKLLNRGAWEESATLEHNRSQRYERIYSIVMIDVDFFKLLNDTQGHQVGDRCLQAISSCLLETSRATDVVGRYGGEEFVVLAPETTLEGAIALAEQIRLAVEGLRLEHAESEVSDVITVSAGVSSAPAHNWQEVLRRADSALYRAKQAGRNCVLSEVVDSRTRP